MPPSVFISYSRADRFWKVELERQLKVLGEQQFLTIWSDQEIETGEDWYPAIQEALATASVAVLLVSASFLTSKFILSEEIPRLLKRREEEGLRLFPVILKPCLWKSVDWLSRFNVWPNDGKTLAALRGPQREAAWATIAEKIQVLLQKIAPAEPRPIRQVGLASPAYLRLPKPRFCFYGRFKGAPEFQPRPELDQVVSWWKEQREGVCALIGLGGVGKTLIVNRFLQMLPQVTAAAPDSPPRDSLPTPNALFYFPFAEFPDPALFFGALAAWLESRLDPSVYPESSFQRAMHLLSDAPPLLIVLDALESMQDVGVGDRSYGQVVDPSLRDFLDRVANGLLPGVRIVAASRFPLTDLETLEASHFLNIDVNRLPEEGAIALLRRRGVHGTNEQLREIVDDCGSHALTVDLTGGYIAEFEGGDPESPHILERRRSNQELRSESDPERRRVLLQEQAFLEITERYRSALHDRDPALLTLMGRICQFRLPVSIGLIARVVALTSPDNPGVMQAVDTATLESQVRYLVEMRLLEEGVGGTIAYGYSPREDVGKLYSVHPAVRKGILSGMDPESFQDSHERISRTLGTILQGRPNDALPTDPAMLDLLTEAIYHTVQAGHYQEAWRMHVALVGGYSNLGRNLGAFWRGARLCSAFEFPREEGQPGKVGLSEDANLLWLYDRGRYLLGLGRLDEAIDVLKEHNSQREMQGNWLYASLGCLYVAGLHLLRGNLAASQLEADRSLEFVERTAAAGFWRDCRAWRGQLLAARGEVELALEDFETGFPRKLYGLDFRLPIEGKALFLAKRGQLDEALGLLQEKNGFLQSHPGRRDRSAYPCELALAEIYWLRGELTLAYSLLEPAYDRAISVDAKEFLCSATLLRARCRLTEAASLTKEHPQLLGKVMEALRSVDEGLRIARECGYGLYVVDLLITRAQTWLWRGRPKKAERDLRTALYGPSGWAPGPALAEIPARSEEDPADLRGVYPPKDSGFPVVLVATHPQCGYAWGEADARCWLGEALLAQAALAKEGDGGIDSQETTPQLLKDAARREIERCLLLSRKLGATATIARAEGILARLETDAPSIYPLMPSGDDRGMASEARRILISYSREDEKWLERLKVHLSPYARNQRLILWDESQVDTGEDREREIRVELEKADIVVFLVSPNLIAANLFKPDDPVLKVVREGKLKVVWIPVSASAVAETELSRFSYVHSPKKPLDQLRPSERNEALVHIAEKISDLLVADS